MVPKMVAGSFGITSFFSIIIYVFRYGFFYVNVNIQYNNTDWVTVYSSLIFMKELE